MANEHDELNDILDKPVPTSSGKASDASDIGNIKYDFYVEPDDIDEKFAQGYCQWSTTDGTIFKPTSQTVEKLIPGVYEVGMSTNIGLFLEKIPIRTEGLIRFPDSNSDEVIDEICKFWERENYFKDYNLIYKRGIMLWGPPGSGKSATIQLIIEDVVKRGGIVIRFDDPSIFLEGMRAVRKIQPDIPVVVIMEDIDSIIAEYSESEVLNILDGVNEVHKVVFLATTNYPGQLGKRIVNRPSRFDKRFKIGMPNEACRKLYFEHLLSKVSEERKAELNIDISKWAKDMEGLSIAHMKELFVAVIILGNDYAKAVKTLQSMKEAIDEREGGGSLGFGSIKRD